MPSLEEFVVLGRIGAPFGVQGLVHVQSFTKMPGDLSEYKIWHLKVSGSWKTYEVEAIRGHGKGFVAKLRGAETRDDAAKLTNLDIGIPRVDLPALSEGDFYWADLLGLKVETTLGEYLGTVAELFETGANDVLVVKGETREHLIPYVPGDYIVDVDLQAGIIKVQWDPEF